MRRRRLSLSSLGLVFAFAPATNALAQTLQLSAPAPITQSVGLGAPIFPVYVDTVPSGTLPANGNQFVGQTDLNARLLWSSTAGPTLLAFTMDWVVDVDSGPIGASLQSQGLLLALSTPTPSNARLELEVANFAFVGASPVASIDVFDDGVLEVGPQVPFATLPIVLGPTPTIVRVRIDASQVNTGSTSLRLDCFPDGDARVTRWNVGCDSVPFAAVPTFDGHFLTEGLAFPGSATIGVLSVGLQGNLLGTLGGLPCLLLPAPEVLLPTTSSLITPIVVPPALRPFSFYGQGVGFGPNGLVTGDAFFCQAL